MRKKYVYLPIMSALSIALTACIDNGASNNIGSANNEAPSTTLGSGGCGMFNSAKSIEVDNVQSLTKGASKGLSAYVVCKDGKKFDITADGSTNWSSNDYNIIEVDNKNYKGKITGVGIGSATLKVVHDGLTTTKQVSVVNSYCGTSAQMIGTHVEPENLDSIPAGGEAELHLYADCTNNTHADITNYASWQSSSKLTIDVNDDGHKGLITGKQKGSANISATLDGQKVYDHKINVDSALLKSLEISGDNTIAKGLTSQLKVIGTYADGDNVDVTKITKYSVIYGNITIDENGLINAKDEGNFKIQASLNGKFDYLEGHVTGAKLLNFTLEPDTKNIIFTPYLNTSASIKARAHYSDGRNLPIPTEQLQCEMEGNQTNITQNQANGCTFSQLGEVNSKVNIKVTYLNDLSIAEQQATASVSLAPIKSIQLIAKNGAFIVGNRTPYKVNLLLADNKTVDVTKNLQLKLKANNHEQEFTPTTPILFDSNVGEIIFNKSITTLTPYTLIASIGDSKTGSNLESSITYNNVYTDEITKEELNEKLVSAFKNEIIGKIKSGDWYAVIHKDNKAEKNDSITKFFTGLASSSSLSIENLSDDDYKKSSNVYNKVIDYDENDPEYKVTARLERNPSNRSSQVILSEFCNNTPVTQSFSSASLSIATTEGFSWGFGEKVGLDIALKAQGAPFVFKGEVTHTYKFEFSSSQTWNKQTTETISLGGATVTLPPRKHAIVVSTLHNTDYYYDGKLPLKVNSEFPVIFRIIDSKNHIRGVGVVDLAKIYVSGKNTYLDRFFELSNHKLYLDLSPQLASSGGKNNKTITHSVYFVDDNQTGTLPCIYPNMLQGINKLSKLYKSGDIQALSHQHGFEFLNRNPDLINTQY